MRLNSRERQENFLSSNACRPVWQPTQLISYCVLGIITCGQSSNSFRGQEFVELCLHSHHTFMACTETNYFSHYTTTTAKLDQSCLKSDNLEVAHVRPSVPFCTHLNNLVRGGEGKGVCLSGWGEMDLQRLISKTIKL